MADEVGDIIHEHGLLGNLLKLNEVLAELDVQYAFGGSIALGYHIKRPRGTDDIDLNIAMSPRDTAVFFAAVPGLEWDTATLQELEQRQQVQVRQNGRKLDIFLPAADFHLDLHANAEMKPIARTMIPVVSATHLTVVKVMFNRPKDWVDIQSMLDAGSVDVDRVFQWLDELIGLDSGGGREFMQRVEGQLTNAGTPMPTVPQTAAERSVRCGHPTKSGEPCRNFRGSCPAHA